VEVPDKGVPQLLPFPFCLFLPDGLVRFAPDPGRRSRAKGWIIVFGELEHAASRQGKSRVPSRSLFIKTPGFCMGRLWKETGIHHPERKARIEPSVAANDVRLIARVRISGPCLAPTSRHHVCGLRGGLPLRRVFLALVLKADVRADYSC
jgi:hypothetical protein